MVKILETHITISASYVQIYRDSASLVLKITFNILLTIGSLPNSIPSFTGSMFDSILLAVLIVEYSSPFLYKLSKNLVPSLINVVHCLKYILYSFLVPDAQESKISFSTSKFIWFLFHRLRKPAFSVFFPLDVFLLVGLISKGWFP